MSGSVQFKGWVPTIAGRLSYNLIGRTLYPTRCVCVNEKFNNKRIIIAYQKRCLNDSILPFSAIYLRYFKGLETTHYFICIAQCRDCRNDSPLEGVIIMVLKDEGIDAIQFWKKSNLWERLKVRKKENFWKERLRPDIKIYQKKLAKLKDKIIAGHQNNGELTYEECFNSLNDSVKNHLTETIRIKPNYVFQSKFTLLRNGIVTFHANSALNDPKKVSQQFYFLKDISHTHQHHKPSLDTLSNVWKTSTSDDITWRKNTVLTFVKKIVLHKRHHNLNVVNNSLGVLAYLQCFDKICSKDLPANWPSKFQFNPNYETLKSSLETKDSQLCQTLEKKRFKWAQIQSLVLGAASIFIAFIGLLSITNFQIEIGPDYYLATIANSLFNSPFKSLLVVLLVLFIYAISFKIIEIQNFTLIKNYFRAIAFLRREKAAWISIVLAAIFISLGILCFQLI